MNFNTFIDILVYSRPSRFPSSNALRRLENTCMEYFSFLFKKKSKNKIVETITEKRI